MEKLFRFYNLVNKGFLRLVLQSSPTDEINDRFTDLEQGNLPDVTSLTPEDAITEVLSWVFRFALPIAALALLLLLGYTGFVIMTSSGNPEKVAEAKEIAVGAISGFALIILSGGLLLLIAQLFNLSLIR